MKLKINFCLQLISGQPVGVLGVLLLNGGQVRLWLGGWLAEEDL